MRMMGEGANKKLPALTDGASDGSGDVISSRAAPTATLSTWPIVGGLQTLWEGEQCAFTRRRRTIRHRVVVVATGSLLGLLIDGFRSA